MQQHARRLPHGPEFRFVDRLLDLEPGKTGTAEYTPRGDEPFFRGHFPGNPILPGVLLVEAAAQLAGIVIQSDPSHPPFADLRLTALRNVKILGAVRPGQCVRLQTDIVARMGPLAQARATAQVNGQPVLVADIILSGT
jgi:3-hydroxyacyl-[acyl-carrier-protein] dehydratase